MKRKDYQKPAMKTVALARQVYLLQDSDENALQNYRLKQEEDR